MSETKKVYQAIAKITEAMSKEGISKSRRNTQGTGYNFRGIDDVLNALACLLAQHQLCILPRVIKREQVERVSNKGGALFYTTLEVEFDLVSAEDGSVHTVRTYGEAMDSGDKSTNKAMSAAYKYMALQAFCIPTEGDNDADAHTHEVAPAKPAALPEDEIVAFIDGISKSRDETVLFKLYSNAYRRAHAAGDAEAERRIIAAKDKRKEELTPAYGEQA